MTPQEKRYRDTICNMLGVPPEATPDELREAKGIIMGISALAPDKETVAITLAAMDLLIETAGQEATYSPFNTLEVGRTYRTRVGAEVTITEHTGRHDRPFRSDGGNTYTEHGRYYGCDNSALDLMAVRNV